MYLSGNITLENVAVFTGTTSSAFLTRPKRHKKREKKREKNRLAYLMFYTTVYFEEAETGQTGENRSIFYRNLIENPLGYSTYNVLPRVSLSPAGTAK